MSLIYFPIIVSLFAMAFVWFLVSQNKKAKDVFMVTLIHGLTVMALGLLAVSLSYFFTGLFWLVGLGFIVCLVYFFAMAKKYKVLYADILSTYCLAIIAAMILGAFLFPRSPQFVFLPLILASIAILALIIGSFFTKPRRIIAATIILSVIGFYLVISKLMVGQPSFWFFGAYGAALAAVALVSVSGIFTHKIYGIILSALAALALFLIYFEQALSHGISIYNLDYIRVIVGILIGGVISSLFVLSLGAKKTKKILFPLLIIVLAPVLTGFILGPQALGGLLVGVIIAGFLTSHDELAMNSLIKGVCMVALLIFSFLV